MDPYKPPATPLGDGVDPLTRVEYDNTFFDLLIFAALHQFFSPALQALVVGLVLFLVSSEFGREESMLGVTAILAVMYYVVLWVVQLALNVVLLYSRKNKTVLTAHVVEIQEDAFYEETKYNRSYFYWEGVVRAIRRFGYVAVYVAAHQAHIIPPRAFRSKSEADKFVSDIGERIKRATSSPSPGRRS